MENDVLLLLGKIIAYGGGISIIFYGVLRYFGKKWLDEKFSKRIEEFKRFQNQEYEKYRFEINKLFNKVSKVHEKEFEILPTLWHKLQDAFGLFVSLSSPFQSHPDLNRYSKNELDSFLERCELLDFQKEEILESDDKLKYYQEKSYWIRLSNARKTLNEFRIYLTCNKIFLSKDLFDLFSDIEIRLLETESIMETMPEKESWKERSDAFRKLRFDGEKVLEKIEIEIQKRLHFVDS